MKTKRISKKICPACEREFTSDGVVCVDDGTLLIPVGNALSVRSVIAERFEVRQVLHIGPGSACILVKDSKDPDTAKALKLMMSRGGPSAPRASERFKRQTERQEQLIHKNIVRVLDHGEDDERNPYIVFEYVDGYPLTDAKQALQALPVAYLLEIISQACDGLEYATENGAVHNDLSPNDILICADADGLLTVKVTDFAKGDPLIHGDNKLEQRTEYGDIFGTPEFMSPEACYRSKTLDARSNVYSLGCILLTMASNTNPLDARNWGAVLLAKMEPRTFTLDAPWLSTDVVQALEKIINKSVEQKPEDRYQTLSALKADLQALYKKENPLPFDKVREAFNDLAATKTV